MARSNAGRSPPSTNLLWRTRREVFFGVARALAKDEAPEPCDDRPQKRAITPAERRIVAARFGLRDRAPKLMEVSLVLRFLLAHGAPLGAGVRRAGVALAATAERGGLLVTELAANARAVALVHERT